MMFPIKDDVNNQYAKKPSILEIV